MQMCRTAEYSQIRDQGDGALLRCARTRPRWACGRAAGPTATHRTDFAVSLRATGLLVSPLLRRNFASACSPQCSASPPPLPFVGTEIPARAADAATGLLAAGLAQHAGVSNDELLAYANRHYERTLMPMAVVVFTGMGRSPRPRRILEVKLTMDVYTYVALARPPNTQWKRVPHMFGNGLPRYLTSKAPQRSQTTP